MLLAFGAGEHGVKLALRATARMAFLLFLPAYAGGALARLAGPQIRLAAPVRPQPWPRLRRRP